MEIIRTQFSLLPKAASNPELSGPAQSWLNENFSFLVLGLLSLLIMLLLVLIVLALRKKTEPSKSEEIKDVLMKSLRRYCQRRGVINS